MRPFRAALLLASLVSTSAIGTATAQVAAARVPARPAASTSPLVQSPLVQSPLVQSPAGREQTADQQVAHALSRLTFGARPGEAARVRAMGLDRWIDQQLAPASIPDSALAPLLAAHTGLDTDLREMRRLYRAQVMARRSEDRAARAGPTRQLAEATNAVAAAKLTRAVASERQLAEVMADFWANHFSVARSKGQTRLYINHYDADVIRPHAMGRFRDLLGAVAKSPAMLFYLDNARSVASRPGAPRGLNENYARELLELHTLGVDGGYTQRDVIETARALTGWTIDPRDGSFAFRRPAHDRDAKQVLGTTLPAGRGIEDGEQVLDLVAAHPATARHIARKLVIRFVSDSPPPSLVERAAATFTRTDGDIAATVRTIVTSDEFYSSEAYRAKVKTPFELVASTYRVLGQTPDATPRGAQLVARLGQPIYGRQTPDGWPDTAAEWMTAGAILSRINFGLLVAGGRLPGTRLAESGVVRELRNECGVRSAEATAGVLDDSSAAASAVRTPQSSLALRTPQSSLALRTPQSCIEAVVSTILAGSASSDTRQVLASGTNPLLERMPAATDSVSAAVRGIRLTPMQQLLGLALGSPEFQRR